MISCFAQIINGYVLGYRIPELVKDEKIDRCEYQGIIPGSLKACHGAC